MITRKLLAGLAVASILVVSAGAVVSLPAVLEEIANAATLAFLVVAVLAIVGAGVGGAGGPSHTKTPYWS